MRDHPSRFQQRWYLDWQSLGHVNDRSCLSLSAAAPLSQSLCTPHLPGTGSGSASLCFWHCSPIHLQPWCWWVPALCPLVSTGFCPSFDVTPLLTVPQLSSLSHCTGGLLAYWQLSSVCSKTALLKSELCVCLKYRWWVK